MPKLTKRFVESIVPNPNKPLKFWDDEVGRFGVIVLPSGRRTYCIEYRNAQRIQKRVKIGIHGQITAEEARNFAKIQLARVIHGEDIAEHSKQIRSLPTFTQLADDYLTLHADEKKRPVSQKEDRRMLNKILIPAFGSMTVESIDRKIIETLHHRLAKKPVQANRTLSLLSKMFTLAISWGWRQDHPVQGIERYQEEKRDRWLDQEELDRLWKALDQYPKHITAYFLKFLLLTGARSGETERSTWSDFDLEKGVWTKPSHLTKKKKMQHLPISEKTVSLLQEIKKFEEPGNPYVFPGRMKGHHLKEPKKFWKTVAKAANLENVRIHDLRHTHASHLVSSGLSLSIVGKLLGHTQAATTQRYAHLADEPLRQAAELFSTKVG